MLLNELNRVSNTVLLLNLSISLLFVLSLSLSLYLSLRPSLYGVRTLFTRQGMHSLLNDYFTHQAKDLPPRGLRGHTQPQAPRCFSREILPWR